MDHCKKMYDVGTAMKIVDILVEDKTIENPEDALEFLNRILAAGVEHRNEAYRIQLQDYHNSLSKDI